jgi:PAS domain S-box-containing protein
VSSESLKAGLPVSELNYAMQSWIGANPDLEERKRDEFYRAEGQRPAQMGSWAFKAAGFEYWSPELFAIHGLDAGSNPPTISEYTTLVHPDDRKFVVHQIRTMVQDIRCFDFIKRIVRPDGSVRHVRWVGTPASCSGMFQGFVGIGIDVTEHEELTNALRKSEAELRQMLDFAPQLVGV